MRPIYSFLLYLVTPFILLNLWWKGRYLPAYRERIPERFFLGNKFNEKPLDVWLHAVSLGEVIAAIPLIDAMLKKNWSVLVTTMTPTGSQRVQTYFGNKVLHQYLPYDLPGVLKRFFKRIKPRVGVVMETELWPNLIHQAQVAQVPLILANARISNDAFRGYQWVKFLIKPLLNQIFAILAQGKEDAERFIALGAKKEKIYVLGNMKFDLQNTIQKTNEFFDLKNLWGAGRVTVVVASTHENEEIQILNELRRLQQAIPDVILLIAPRHPERFQCVYQLCIQQGFKTGLRSDRASLNAGIEIVVLDSLGELLGFYQASNYAFVGGSLVPVGGHNILEPIAMNIPVITGKHMQNFKDICHELQANQGIVLVQDAKEVVDGIIELHADPRRRQKIIKNAGLILEKNKGAVNRCLKQIEGVYNAQKRS